MAATDITYGGLDPVLYTPDFSFLRYTLDKKTSQYEQGLQQVSSAYNSLKKELTDPVNSERRDEYLKNAQGQLQKIASSDLSLQQNVNFANTIFDPMATDKAFLYDSYHTQRIKKEMAQMENWKQSEDPEERKKYSGEVQEWLARDLNSIKNGKGDLNNYKVEGRSAFAMVDAQDILDKAVKDKGFEYKVDDFGQPYIVTTKGGVGGTENYRTFAENVLASDPVYQQQLSILGQARQEKAVEVYKANPLYSNLSDADIYKEVARTTYNDHKTAQKKYIDDINATIEKDDAEISAKLNGPDGGLYTQGKNDVESGNLNTPNAQLYLDLKKKADARNSLNSQYADAKMKYTNTYEGADKEQAFVDSFAKNPRGYFSDLQFKNDVTRFSNIKSASVERTIKEDRAYVDVMVAKTNATRLSNDIQDDIQDNLNDAQKLKLEEAKLNAKGLKTITKADGTKEVVAGEADVVRVDIDATQVNILNSLTKLKDQVDLNSSIALQSVTGTFGALSMLGNMGMDPTKVGKLRNLYTKYYTGGKQTVGMTAEESKIMNEAFSYMQAFSKNNPNNTLLSQKYKTFKIQDLPDMLDKAMTGYEAKNDNDVRAKKAIEEYKSASSAVQIASAGLDAGKQAVIETKKSDPAFAGMFVKRKGNDGKEYTDLINENDIKSWFSPYIKDKKVLDKVATQYLNGTLNYNENYSTGKGGKQNWLVKSLAYIPQGGAGTLESTTINVDGKAYVIPNKQTSTAVSKYTNVGGVMLNKTTGFSNNSTIPVSPKKYQELTKKINTEVQVPEFGAAAGMVYGSPFYKLNGAVKQQVINTLGHITPTNSNMYSYDGTSEPIQVKPEIQKAVRDAIASKDSIAEITLMTSSPTNKGGQSVQVKFAVDLKKGDKDHPLAGQSFFFPITPTEASADIFNIFNKVKEVSEFEPYKKKGDIYHLDTFQAEGIKAEFIPTSPGSSQGVVRVYQKAYNDRTRSYSNDFQQIGTDVEYSLDNTSFPELKQMVYNSFIDPYVSGKIRYRQQTGAASGSTSSTPSSIYSNLLTKRN
jgi:hypothetical protein